MKHRFLIVLAVVLSQSVLKAAEWVPPAPVVEAFSGQKYREIKWEPSFVGYSLGQAYIAPSCEWIAFRISDNLQTIGRSRIHVVGAYHVSSGRTRQLAFPAASGKSAWSTWVAEDLRPAFVPMGGNRLGIVSEHLHPNPQEAGSRDGGAAMIGICPPANPDSASTDVKAKYFLWEWDLDADGVRLVGPWDFSMTPIARAIQLQQSRICWTSGGNTLALSGPFRSSDENAWNGELALLDLKSRKSTRVKLDTRTFVMDTDGQTYAPTTAPCAFAVSDPVPKDGLRVYCVDPNVPNGIRWKLDNATLEAAVGPRIEEGGFFHQIGFPCHELPLVVRSLRNNKFSLHLVFLDEKTGRITRHSRIPLDPMDGDLPIISRDKRRIVADVSLMDNENEDEDDDFRTVFRVIDLDSGNYRDSENVADDIDSNGLVGFLDDDRAVVSDAVGIWVLDTGKDLRLTRLFQLRGPEDFQGSLDLPPTSGDKHD